MSSKVKGFLRATGLIELFIGILVIEYAGSQEAIASQCEATSQTSSTALSPVPLTCFPPIDYGLYYNAGYALIILGLVQIVASNYISRRRALKHRVATKNIPVQAPVQNPNNQA